MLRRLARGAALVAAASMVLAGCTQPENDPTDEELASRAGETFERFYEVVDDQFAAGHASAVAFEAYATPEMGERWARDIQAALDAGTSSSGVLRLTNVELRERGEGSVRAALCTDGSGVQSTSEDGGVIPPSGLVAWDATFVTTADDSRLLINDLQPSEDQTVCNS